MRAFFVAASALLVGFSSNISVSQELQSPPRETLIEVCGAKFRADSEIAKDIAAVKPKPICHEEKDGRGLSKFVFLANGIVEHLPDADGNKTTHLIVIAARYEEPIPGQFSPGQASSTLPNNDLANTDNLQLVPEGLLLPSVYGINGNDGLFYVCARVDRRAHSSGFAERTTICRSHPTMLQPQEIDSQAAKIQHDDIGNLQM